MKSTIALMISIIALAIASVCGYCMYQLQQADTGQPPLSEQQQDQVKQLFNEYNDSLQNPAFTSVKEVFDFLSKEENKNDLIADFKAIPIDVVVNVAQVCLDGKPYVYMSDIINSYKQHQDVYNKLTTDGVIQDAESLADKPSETDSAESNPPIVKPDSTKQ